MKNKNTNSRIHALINDAILISDKFIKKVESGRARSVETFSDLQKLKSNAELLKSDLANSTMVEVSLGELRTITRDIAFSVFNEIMAGAKTPEHVETEANNAFNYYWKKLKDES